MRRQADRFERLADKSWHNWEAAVTPPRIAQLLRREHRAVVRLLNKDLKECEAVKRRTLLLGERTAAFGWQCRADQCQYILDRLIARAR